MHGGGDDDDPPPGDGKGSKDAIDLGPKGKSGFSRVVEAISRKAATKELKIPKCPAPVGFTGWRAMVRTEVTSRSGDPDAGFDWIIAVKPKTFDQLADVEGRALLDQELASALTRAQTGELGRRIANMEEKLMHDGKRLRGRQMLHMVYEYYKLDEGQAPCMTWNTCSRWSLRATIWKDS